MAAKLLKEPGDADERITRAFLLFLSRSPSAEEKQRLRKLLEEEIAALKKGPEEVKQVVDSRSSENIDPAQLAAWTTVSRVILNLDETITRE
jgi:hypothetical protein